MHCLCIGTKNNEETILRCSRPYWCLFHGGGGGSQSQGPINHAPTHVKHVRSHLEHKAQNKDDVPLVRQRDLRVFGLALNCSEHAVNEH